MYENIKPNYIKKSYTGIVLAGGKSSRMQGIDKAQLIYKEKTLTANGYQILAPLCNEVLVSSNKIELGLPENTNIITDTFQNIGPTGGLHATLSKALHECCLIITCDTPLLKPELYKILVKQDNEKYDAIIPIYKGKVHPLSGILKKSILPILTSEINNGNYKIYNILKKTRLLEIAVENFFSQDIFVNINAQSDYQTLIQTK